MNKSGPSACAALLSIALTAFILTPALGRTHYSCDEAIKLHSYALEVSFLYVHEVYVCSMNSLGLYGAVEKFRFKASEAHVTQCNGAFAKTEIPCVLKYWIIEQEIRSRHNAQ